jgi:hypothetical protein
MIATATPILCPAFCGDNGGSFAPSLSVHYAPGMLVVLKRHGCKSWNHGKHRHECGKAVETVAGLHLLQGDEQAWCLERSWVKK